MNKKKFIKFFLIILILILPTYFLYLKFFENNKDFIIEEENEEFNYNSNIIKNVEYTTKDADGNEYFIRALEGQIEFSNPNIIYLWDVKALIKLKDSEDVTIISDYGKYNSENFNTIFSKNVIIKYLDNNINGDYLDFSLERNSLIISKNVIYTNLSNTLKADVLEMNIRTKDTKIYMLEDKKKVNIKSIN